MPATLSARYSGDSERDPKGSFDLLKHLNVSIDWETANLLGQAWYSIRDIPLRNKSASLPFRRTPYASNE